MTMCNKCGGLIAEPNTAYGYSGLWCYCQAGNKANDVGQNSKQYIDHIKLLQDRIAELEAELDKCTQTVDDNSQDWKGMDGATAFWLIERHSNNWTDAKKMMDEWFEANTHPAKTLTDEEILREAYYILMREQQRKAQEK
jgi:hypothetical protein